MLPKSKNALTEIDDAPMVVADIFLSALLWELGMSELEMKDDVETEEFADELSDEALDREVARAGCCCCSSSRAGN